MAAPSVQELRREFLLDPAVAFLSHRIEIPIGGEQMNLPRLSVAAYTTRDEIDRLLAALVRELDAEHRQQDE